MSRLPLPRFSLPTVRVAVLSVAGLVFLVIAAWGVDWRLGCAAAGVACLVLEWQVSE